MRALIIREPTDGSFAQPGTSPQRATRSDRRTWSSCSRSTTIRTGSVGARFQDGGSSSASSATFAVAPPNVAEDALLLPPSWNLAPTDPVRIVVEREQDDQVRRSLRVARWGLVPGWAKDPSVGSRMINARIETLTTTPAFRKAAASRRCLVPAEGYFEWQEQEQAGAEGAGLLLFLPLEVAL